MCVCALFNEMLRLSALHAFTRRKPNTKSSLVTATPPLLKREKKDRFVEAGQSDTEVTEKNLKEKEKENK